MLQSIVIFSIIGILLFPIQLFAQEGSSAKSSSNYRITGDSMSSSGSGSSSSDNYSAYQQAGDAPVSSEGLNYQVAESKSAVYQAPAPQSAGGAGAMLPLPTPPSSDSTLAPLPDSSSIPSAQARDIRDQATSDTTPPVNSNAFHAIPGDEAVLLLWTNPKDEDFDRVVIKGQMLCIQELMCL